MKKKVPIPFLYFLLPLFLVLLIDYARNVSDIWFLFSHGRYVLSHGFPHIEFLTVHHNLHFVMQQWGFSVLLYSTYHLFGSVGVFCLMALFNVLLLYFLYRFCMVISSNNTFASCLVASVIDLLLEFCFIIPRPQLVSILLFVITLYLLERLSHNKDDKGFYFLPLISVILINFHASMWFMLFVFCMPFVVEFLYFFIKKRDKRFFSLLFVMILSFAVGILNPYGIENMLYVFSSYGIPLFNKMIREMHSFSIDISDSFLFLNSSLILIVLITEIIVYFIRRKKYSIHSYFLCLGCSLMAFLNLRNMSLFFIASMPFLVHGISKKMNGKISLKIFIPFFLIMGGIFVFHINSNFYEIRDDYLEPFVDYLDSTQRKDLAIYTDFGDGAYLEYFGYKVYIDSRAEVFIKKINHKEDIFEEYYHVWNNDIDYNQFVEKYQFTHLIVDDNTGFADYLKKRDDYTIVNKNMEKLLFERSDFHEKEN